MKLDNIIAVRPTKKIYREENLVIKVFNEEYSAAEVLNEALNLAIVEGTGFKSPKLNEVTKIDGSWAIVTEYIEGVTLSKLIEENPGRFDEYLDRFVDIQLDMHKYTAKQLRHLTDKMHGKISQSGLDATTRYELHTRLDSLPKHTKLCHGDFNPSNIIITDNGEAYVIDWSHATQGNASADAARTYLLFRLAGENGKAEKYMDLFCKKSDTAKQYVQKWLAIVAASQLVKGKAEEKEFLRGWVNVMDYE
ncbi:MAG: phosphotransferase [Oscillospiraceae bacterium]|jgi:tRNA A-37 threonylcarbamoyl transferase component Bud32|nr:phosphotransferase [Oscillospiraceae bacterium]